MGTTLSHTNEHDALKKYNDTIIALKKEAAVSGLMEGITSIFSFSPRKTDTMRILNEKANKAFQELSANLRDFETDKQNVAETWKSVGKSMRGAIAREHEREQ